MTTSWCSVKAFITIWATVASVTSFFLVGYIAWFCGCDGPDIQVAAKGNSSVTVNEQKVVSKELSLVHLDNRKEISTGEGCNCPILRLEFTVLEVLVVIALVLLTLWSILKFGNCLKLELRELSKKRMAHKKEKNDRLRDQLKLELERESSLLDRQEPVIADKITLDL